MTSAQKRGKLFTPSWLGLLLGGCAALLTSCFSLSDRTWDWNIPDWKDPSFQSFSRSSNSESGEEFRRHWLRIAPEKWQKRVVGLSFGGKSDEVLLNQQGQWILLLGWESDRASPQTRAVAFIGRLIALEESQIETIYLYPPIHDPILQSHYLQADLARVPTASFLLFQPELGRSVIPFDDSLIARYVTKFYPGIHLFRADDPVSAQEVNPIDDFAESWVVMVENSPAAGARREKVAFLSQEDSLNQLANQVRRLIDG